MRKLIIIAWTICVLIQEIPAKEAYCGPTPYKTNTSICCDSKVIDRWQDGVEKGCCNASGEFHVYNKKTELCCGNQVGVNITYYDHGKAYKLECCEKNGKIAKEHLHQICCSGVLVQKEKSTETCCGQEKYDEDSQTCCLNTQKPDTYRIYNKPRSDGDDCCGSKLFNRNDGTYCTNKYYETLSGSDSALCGNTSYNISTHLCSYEETVVPKPQPAGPTPPYAIMPSYRCREGIIYDSNKYHFVPTDKRYNINGRPIPNGYKSCGNDHYNPAETRYQQFCCDHQLRNASVDQKLDCCGTELYNIDNERCCDGQIINGTKKCCGNKVYDTKENRKCCGGILYDDSLNACCSQRHVVKLEYKNHTACCTLQNGEFKTYNEYDNKICSRGQIKDASSASLPPRDSIKSKKNETENCPYCGEHAHLQIHKTKNRKREYRVSIEKLTTYGRHFELRVRFLGKICPYHKRMTISIKYSCPCLVKGRRYTIITNRKLLNKSHVRLNHRDMIMLNSASNKKLRRTIHQMASKMIF